MTTAHSQDWSQAKLWIQLQATAASSRDETCLLLQTVLPDIERILRSAATSPTDFTLHDADHSFRVAERMVEIMPANSFLNLTPYELGLLLLAAYLHDIGMTPHQARVQRHFQYLLNGRSDDPLSEQEVASIERWLDEDERGLSIPLTADRSPDEAVRTAGYLTTHYCRSKHNDWSENWIRTNISQRKLGSYSNWVDDLVVLCRSHHEGQNELLSPKFDPRPVGAQAVMVHLRYLACVLRVADIFDFDPERTPEVILNHRAISPGSKVYWHKDQHISMLIKDGLVSVYARPPTAPIHRAIESMMDDIDHELRLCTALDAQTHFNQCPNFHGQLKYEWKLAQSVFRDVRPKDEAYEYINGSFRPNTRKILELLSGTQLYQTPFAAVRELLQNSFDAVREQIAYKRLQLKNPAARHHELDVGRFHSVDVRVELRADGAWLVCEDTGVGMTKAILTNHFLVSGQARRHDVLKLERQCKAAGFSSGRTGQFGIGVLSYFMIADRVVIETRRSLEAGDSESNGWLFETRRHWIVWISFKDEPSKVWLKNRTQTSDRDSIRHSRVDISAFRIHQIHRPVCLLQIHVQGRPSIGKRFFSGRRGPTEGVG